MARFQDYLKNIFWVILILQFAPVAFRTIYKQWSDHVDPKNKVGYIILNHMICSSTLLTKQLTQFFKDPEIKAILIKIDSGGGAAGSTQAICDEIIKLKQKYPKPIVSYIENVGASGAYEIAAMTDHIVSTGSAIVGSIGAKIPTQLNIKEFLQNYKIQTHEIASSNYKNAGDPLTDFTPEQKAMLQKIVDDGAEQFAQNIASHRHLDLSQKAQWAEGKVFTGAQGLSLKLIDQIGNQTTAIDYIKSQILHADREVELVKAPAPSKWQRLLHPEQDCDDEVQNSVAVSFWQALFHVIGKEQGMQF